MYILFAQDYTVYRVLKFSNLEGGAYMLQSMMSSCLSKQANYYAYLYIISEGLYVFAGTFILTSI